MKTIKITRNNGSLPDFYSKQFELIFHSNGKSTFKLVNGRDEEATEVLNESKQINPKDIEKIIYKAEHLQFAELHKPNIGGPQRIITIYTNNKEIVLEIQPTEIEALHFINHCLLLCDSGLPNRLVDVFHSQ